MPIVEEIIQNPEDNLFNYLWLGLNRLRDYFGFSCELIVSSSLPANHALKSQDRVIDICQVMNVRTYITPRGAWRSIPGRILSNAGFSCNLSSRNRGTTRILTRRLFLAVHY